MEEKIQERRNRKMTKLESLLIYLEKNPTATYDEIYKDIKVNKQMAKTYIYRLKVRGYLAKDENGYKVLKTFTEETGERNSRADYKIGVIQHLIDTFTDDFDNAQSFEERDGISKRVIQLLHMI